MRHEIKIGAPESETWLLTDEYPCNTCANGPVLYGPIAGGSPFRTAPPLVIQPGDRSWTRFYVAEASEEALRELRLLGFDFTTIFEPK